MLQGGKRVLEDKAKDLKNDIQILKVSVAYIHPNLQCCEVFLFVAHHRIM
jgi:hypothetical protein